MEEEALMVRNRENLMNYPPPHPRLSMRKTVQLMVILTILAWATQTLFHQWGYGAVIEQNTAGPPTTVEIREEASAFRGVIRLQDVARWSGRDGAVAGHSEVVISVFQTPELIKTISASRVRSALERAGVSPMSLKLSGASLCRVTRAEQTVTPETIIESSPTPHHKIGAGEFITVNFTLNGQNVKTVLKALESGTQTIRAKNEATGTEYSVKLTGAGEGVCVTPVTTGN
jgi:hypothetical protein